MKIIRSISELAGAGPRPALAIGVFDGVHRGHQAVIDCAMQSAQKVEGTAVVVTFDPHPMTVLAPEKAPALLTPTEYKLRLFESMGIPVCLVISFDAEFSRKEPRWFIESLFQNSDQLQQICVGHRWAFGHQRKGNVALIEQIGREKHFQVREVDFVRSDDHTISSTAIRQSLKGGKLEAVREMLGRPYSLWGKVVEGDRIGRTIGFPTANLSLQNQALPPSGVYVVRGFRDGQSLKGVMNIGHRPTLTEAAASIRAEVHFLEFNGDLYGRQLEVRLEKFLRSEHKFSHVNDLKAQITRDVAEATSYFGESK